MPTLTANVFNTLKGRKSKQKIVLTRAFDAQDFTRAWRSMRCWAWRKGYIIVTEKDESKTTHQVALTPPTPSLEGSQK